MLACLVSAGPCFAQSSGNAPARQWWFGIGTGLADASGGDTGTLELSSLNFGVGASQVQLRYLYYDSETLPEVLDCVSSLFSEGCDEVTTISEWGVLYGRRLRGGNLIVAGGLGSASYDNTGAPGLGRHHVRSVPLELTWSFARRGWHGLHLKFAVSHSREDSAYGLVFGADLGRLEGW
jgi:hypothetical protein